MTPEVDVETLRLLVAVAETGSLAKAARTRGISQPAASARMRAFEARWSLRVIERSPRGSSLTTDGRAIVAWAREALHGIDVVQSGLAALSSERRSSLVVAASLTMAEFVLPEWLAGLRRRLPEVHPRLHVVNSERVACLVRDREAAIGFIETADYPSDLRRRTLGHDRLIVIVDPRHPWARRRAVPDAELREALWVLREEGSGTRSTFEHALGTAPGIALEASSTTALISAVTAGLGPAVISARAVASDLASGRLAEAPTGLDLDRPLSAIWRGDEELSGAAATLLGLASG